MAEVFNFHVQRFPEKADPRYVSIHTIPLLPNGPQSARLKRVRDSASRCQIESAVTGAAAIAQDNLDVLATLEVRIAELERIRQQEAKDTADAKRVKIREEIDRVKTLLADARDALKKIDRKRNPAAYHDQKQVVDQFAADLAKLQDDLAAVVPQPGPKSKEQLTLEAIAFARRAVSILADIDTPAGKRAFHHFVEENRDLIIELFDDDAAGWAHDLVAETLAALMILRQSTRSDLPDLRLLLRSIAALREVRAQLLDRAQWGGRDLVRTVEVVERPIRVPGWVRKVDPCCCEPADGNPPTTRDRELASKPLAMLARLEEYKTALAEADKLTQQELDKLCWSEADERCLPQNPCCMQLNSYVTDLLTVRQTALRYEASDIAHIQNVMAGETIARTHETLLETEEYSETETRKSRSSEHDHQTSERFELQEAAQKTLTQDFAADAGITASAKYGPPGSQVAVTTDANVSYASSKSEAQQQAKTFARSVTQRSVLKLQEETRTLSSFRVLRRITEKNLHQFDGGSQHIIGQYYWVDKVSDAQVMNWGRRMMYEFVVPEPAALYKELMRRRAEKAKTPEEDIPEPPFPQIEPGDITRSTYMNHCAYYGVAGEAPPPKTLHGFVSLTGQPSTVPKYAVPLTASAAKPIPIPEGYYAAKAHFTGAFFWSHWQKNEHGEVDDAEPNAAWISIGSTTEVFWRNVQQPEINRSISLNDEASNSGAAMPVELISMGIEAYSIQVEVEFEITAELEDEWRFGIYRRIMEKYARDLAEYEAKKAAVKPEPLFEIKGRSAGINREMEQTELKRQLISIISCQHFDRFKAMLRKVRPCGYPQLDFQKAEEEGAFIQFFEQAFEWKQMMYLFYPYFWGDKCDWSETIETDSGDALFDKFLSAGAARVQVPVRPGFEPQMLHYETTGETWLGQGRPDYDEDSPHYVAMHEEFRNQTGNFQEDREGLVDLDFDFNDGNGNPLTSAPEQVMIKGTDRYWDWIGQVDPAHPSDWGGIDFTAVGEDIDREIVIHRKSYRIVAIDIYRGADAGNPPHVPTQASQEADPGFIAGLKWIVTLDRKVETQPGVPRKHIMFAVGAIYAGAPWEIVTPTNLVWLRPSGKDGYDNCLPHSLPVECGDG